MSAFKCRKSAFVCPNRIADGRVPPDRYVSFADAFDALAVEIKSMKSRSPCNGQRNDLLPVGRPDKVFLPDVHSRVEERYVLPSGGISGAYSIALTAIAMKASKGQIFLCGVTTQTYRHDVIEGKGHILPGFVRVAVFIQRRCSCPDLGL